MTDETRTFCPPFAGITQVRFLRSAAHGHPLSPVPRAPACGVCSDAGGRLRPASRRFKPVGYDGAMDELATSRRRFVSHLAARFLVRFHMSLMFAGTLAAALLTSRLLLLAGVHSLMVRYAMAAVGGYLGFFLLVRGWIFYVTRVGPSAPGLDLPDVSPGFGGGGGGGPGPGFHAGGGHFGDGGASGSFDDAAVVPTLADAGGGGGGGGSSGSWSFGLDLDEGIWIVIALLVLVACLGGAAIYLVWQAPGILPQAAFEALLAAGLVKAARTNEARGWMRGVVRSTVIPFALILAAAVLVGWTVHHACPTAIRLADVLHHCR